MSCELCRAAPLHPSPLVHGVGALPAHPGARTTREPATACRLLGLWMGDGAWDSSKKCLKAGVASAGSIQRFRQQAEGQMLRTEGMLSARGLEAAWKSRAEETRRVIWPGARVARDPSHTSSAGQDPYCLLLPPFSSPQPLPGEAVVHNTDICALLTVSGILK